MIIERTSSDGLTMEIWSFVWANGRGWVCDYYDRATRAKKSHKTWRLVATSKPDGIYYRWSSNEYKNAEILDAAPIDDALAVEIRLRASEAPIVAKRSVLV